MGDQEMAKILVNYNQIENGFIGQCADNPQFLVQTKSKNEIKVEITEMIEDYVKLFPNEKPQILPEGDDFEIVLSVK